MGRRIRYGLIAAAILVVAVLSFTGLPHYTEVTRIVTPKTTETIPEWAVGLRKDVKEGFAEVKTEQEAQRKEMKTLTERTKANEEAIAAIRDMLADRKSDKPNAPPDDVIAEASTKLSDLLKKADSTSVSTKSDRELMLQILAQLDRIEKRQVACGCGFKRPHVVRRARRQVTRAVHYYHHYEEQPEAYYPQPAYQPAPQPQYPYWQPVATAAPAQPAYQYQQQSVLSDIATPLIAAGNIAGYFNQQRSQPVNIYNNPTAVANSNAQVFQSQVQYRFPHNQPPPGHTTPLKPPCCHFDNTNPNRPLGPTPINPMAQPYRPVAPAQRLTATVPTPAPRAPVGMPQPPSQPSGIQLKGH